MTELPLQPDLDGLLTESRREDTAEIDLASTVELVRAMNDEDARVPAAVRAAEASIAAAVEAVADRLAAGGRLIYIGAGTAGRLGVLDASEAVPTFSSDPGQVVGVLAGGAAALSQSVEEIEDDTEAGRRDLERVGVGPLDAVVGVSASGRTPYVLGGVTYARGRGAATVGLSCNPQAALSALVDYPIEVIVGPELIAGSTRLKAGTAQKLVLNMISTIAMIKLGKTFGNLMVDLRATNTKLRARAVRIVAQAAGVTDALAGETLAEAGDDVRVAILMLLAGVGAGEARARLEASGRNLRAALGSRPGGGAR
jgi:N-acetylmuramic acid 6-phosphate etherase